MWTASSSSSSSRTGPLSTALAAFAFALQIARVAAAPFTCTGDSVYVVAHADDDLLFQSPTLSNEVDSGLCITTVILTAGDAGLGLNYAKNREIGNRAAYAQMAGVSNTYTDSYATFGGQSVLLSTMTAVPRIQKVFMRLPDGNHDGGGFGANNYQSLRSLYTGSISSIKAIDGTATYTLATLRTAISEIFAARAPNTVRTLDYTRDYDTGDHSDHLTAARLAAERPGSANLVGYMGYSISDLPETFSTSSTSYKDKSAAFFAYTPYDYNECQNVDQCSNGVQNYWLHREYLVGSVPSTGTGTGTSTTTTTPASPTGTATLPSGTNIARQATASASSQSSDDQAASKAIDGVVDGWPGDYTAEWASAGEQAGAWITLTWPSAVVVQSVVLYDRLNENDWLKTGYLTFDDGSTVQFTMTDNMGGATVLSLSKSYTTQSIKMTVSSVSSTTQNVGLAEFQVYGTTCSTCTVTTTTSTTMTTTTTTAPTSTATAVDSSNLAQKGTASASSYNSGTGQSPDKAIDGLISGYKADGSGDYSQEWTSDGEKTGAWWTLTWASSVTINRVVLYDRPNTDDWITAGTITFSDGSTLAITSLDNAGGATTFDFAAKTVNSLTFRVTSVGSNTQNIGLSEFQAFNVASGGSSPTTTTSPSTTTISKTSTTSPPATTTTTSTTPAASPTSGISANVALNGTSTASSYASGDQGPEKANDGTIGGWPVDYTKEWSSNGERAGAWWQLTWTSSVTINRIVLTDRPNTNDWITAGTLTFSDGSTVAVPSLDNGGAATTITFSSKTVKSVRLSITSVGDSTVNIGLSEFQVYYVS